jgi:putative RecB family exonuclease
MNRQEFKISYSRINTYLFCPYKYKLVYLDNLHIPVSPDITFGHIIHKTLEQFHAGKDQPKDALFEHYDKSWKSNGFNDPRQIFEYYQRGIKMLENYYISFCQVKPEVLYVEKSFDANIGKYRFIGIIDRIDRHGDGTYEVMDYKTHVQSWEQERIDKDLQLSFYAYACKNIFKFNPNKISVYFLSDNRKVYTKRTKEDINNAINIALDVAEKIVIENFDPDLSKCSICDFRFKCKH